MARLKPRQHLAIIVCILVILCLTKILMPDMRGWEEINVETQNNDDSSNLNYEHLKSSGDEGSFIGRCPKMSPLLVGRLSLDTRSSITMETVEREQYDSMVGSTLPPERLPVTYPFMGGYYHPPKCVARHRVAIVIPFRDRDRHLTLLLNHVLPILRRQLLEFQVYVIEQVSGGNFNRGMLRNIGFVEAMKVQRKRLLN